MKTFFDLVPDEVLKAVDRLGYETTGEYLQLNSYENRVFELTLENREKVVAKFYRPNRWNMDALKEEHEFLKELESAGFPVVSPLKTEQQDSTLSEYNGMFYCVFPKARGRLPQELLPKDLLQVGKSLAHLHNVGAQKKSQHRPSWIANDLGHKALSLLKPILPPQFRSAYESAGTHILQTLHELEKSVSIQRIHGDCHRGNLLQTDEPGKPQQFFFMDFDDFGLGPVAQDFWMLCAGDEDEASESLDSLLEGYGALRSLESKELALMEPLRGLRIMHYAAWIHRRWEDPSFPRLFPQFGSENYWFEELKQLEAIADAL